jgi:hypothetical protein
MALFSIVYWLFFLVSLPPLILIQLAIFLVTAPFDRRRTWVHLFGCAWGMLYVWVNPIWKVKVEGREKLPWHGPAVITANHLSNLDNGKYQGRRHDKHPRFDLDGLGPGEHHCRETAAHSICDRVARRRLHGF